MIGTGSQLDQGVEGDVDVGKFVAGPVVEVGEDAAEDSLVRDDHHIGLEVTIVSKKLRNK